jgi:two-component system response regulator AtoC
VIVAGTGTTLVFSKKFKEEREMAKARILVIDDEESPRESLRFILKDRYEVVTRANGTTGLQALKGEGPFDLVTLDMKMPDMSGLEVLSEVLKFNPAMPVVMVTALTDARPAVQAMKMGAADYISKPFDVDEIRLVVQRALREKSLEKEVGRLRSELQGSFKFENIIGSGPAMQQVYNLIQRMLDTDTTVLIGGETGTGKELVARALHYNSARRDGPFTAVHCAAIPSELLESELFGHEKGAFTGALQRRIGMFEAASGGTLFLDEIGEMPTGTQGKLLRAIQEREIRRVGSQDTININVRLVCATNRDLQQEVASGRFREDLFYRINVVPIILPALRDRKEDIPGLVIHFAQRFSKELDIEVPQFTPQAMDLFVNYSWPGNVRELEHAVERLLVTSDAKKITVHHLPFVISQSELATASVQLAGNGTAARAGLGEKLPLENADGELDLIQMTEEVERKAIEEALRRSSGALTEAARLLKVSRRVLTYRMNKLGIKATGAAATDSTNENSDNAHPTT